MKIIECFCSYLFILNIYSSTLVEFILKNKKKKTKKICLCKDLTPQPLDPMEGILKLNHKRWLSSFFFSRLSITKSLDIYTDYAPSQARFWHGARRTYYGIFEQCHICKGAPKFFFSPFLIFIPLISHLSCSFYSLSPHITLSYHFQ